MDCPVPGLTSNPSSPPSQLTNSQPRHARCLVSDLLQMRSRTGLVSPSTCACCNRPHSFFFSSCLLPTASVIAKSPSITFSYQQYSTGSHCVLAGPVSFPQGAVSPSLDWWSGLRGWMQGLNVTREGPGLAFLKRVKPLNHTSPSYLSVVDLASAPDMTPYSTGRAERELCVINKLLSVILGLLLLLLLLWVSDSHSARAQRSSTWLALPDSHGPLLPQDERAHLLLLQWQPGYFGRAPATATLCYSRLEPLAQLR